MTDDSQASHPFCPCLLWAISCDLTQPLFLVVPNKDRRGEAEKRPLPTLLFVSWGFDHLATLCDEFEDWYNTWRPHMTLDGFRPDDVYYDRKPKKPQRDSKTVPTNIQQHLFRETRVTGYRLKDVA